MDRKDFLDAIGKSAMSLVIFNCLGCAKNSGGAPNAPTDVDFTLDLNTCANAALLTNGGFLAHSGVLVARTTTGNFIAVQQSCTHESYTLNYQAASHRFYCNNHGAVFGENGAVSSGPTNRSLVVYNTQLNGTTLRVFS